MLKFVALAALLAIGAAPAIAQAPSAGTAPAKAQDPDKKICQRVEETGSRLGDKRICKTRAEWAAERQESRNELERAQRNVGIDSGR